MKKYFIAIIMTFSFFSIATPVNASNFAAMDEYFNIEYSPENTRLEYGFDSVEHVQFQNLSLAIRLDKFKRADRAHKDSFIQQYEAGKISYYGMNDLVRNYNYYVYHINKLFFYQSIKEVSTDYQELDNAIIFHSTQARSFFNKVKNILKNEKEKQGKKNLFDLYS